MLADLGLSRWRRSNCRKELVDGHARRASPDHGDQVIRIGAQGCGDLGPEGDDRWADRIVILELEYNEVISVGMVRLITYAIEGLARLDLGVPARYTTDGTWFHGFALDAAHDAISTLE